MIEFRCIQLVFEPCQCFYEFDKVNHAAREIKNHELGFKKRAVLSIPLKVVTNTIDWTLV
jgi:hypothetical protein